MNNVHPSFSDHAAYWVQMADTIEGETAVKAKGIQYLPMTAGMKLLGTKGTDLYDAYKARAIFYGFVEETANSMLGLMHRLEANVQLPAGMDDYHLQMTPDGYGLQAFIQYLNSQQIEFGRLGVLVEVKDGATSQDLPYMAIYEAATIANWDSEFVNGEEVVNFVVLDESGFVLEDMNWTEKKSYRVLLLIDGVYSTYTVSEESMITRNPEGDGYEVIQPSIAGKTLNYIPFVFVNATNTHSTCEKPPLLDLSNLCLSVYRQEADYRHALFMNSQATPYAKGVTAEEMKGVMLGASGMLRSDNPDAEFGYIETSGAGLEAQAKAVENLKLACIRRGVSFIEQGSNESGKALETRLSTKTAMMKTIAATGKSAIEQLLLIVQEWNGMKGDIIVTVNTDFADDNVTAQDFVQVMSAKTMGAPMALESIHGWAKERGFTKLDFDEEMTLIEEEMANLMWTGQRGAPDPNDPPADGNQNQ